MSTRSTCSTRPNTNSKPVSRNTIQNDNKSILVANLPDNITTGSLFEFMTEKFGGISECRLVFDNHKFSGTAVVKFRGRTATEKVTRAINSQVFMGSTTLSIGLDDGNTKKHDLGESAGRPDLVPDLAHDSAQESDTPATPQSPKQSGEFVSGWSGKDPIQSEISVRPRGTKRQFLEATFTSESKRSRYETIPVNRTPIPFLQKTQLTRKEIESIYERTNSIRAFANRKFQWARNVSNNISDKEQFEFVDTWVPVISRRGPTVENKDRIQENLHSKIQVCASNIHGWGLSASRNLRKGEFIMEYLGEIITFRQSDIREKRYQENGIQETYFFQLGEDTVIDATKYGNVARLANHSCTPNCVTTVKRVDGRLGLYIYAAREIEKGEELTYNYHMEFKNGETRSPCLCRQDGCTGYIDQY